MALIDEEKKKRVALGAGVTPSDIPTYGSVADAKTAIDKFTQDARAAAAPPVAVPPPTAPVDSTPEPTMGYGAQMRKVGGAVMDAGAAVAKTIVGAPGYGVNRLLNPELNLQQQTQAADGAGAGRGFVNPAAVAPRTTPPVGAAAMGAGSAVPAVAAPAVDPRTTVTLNGQAGAQVPGALGVSKFTANGRTLYSNVTGTDNDALMSGKPGVQVAPAAQPSGAGLGAGSPDNAYDQPGVLSNGPGMRVVGGSSFFRGPNDPGSPSLSTLGVGRVSGREAARLANAGTIAANQNATSRANNADSNATTAGGQELSAETQRLGATTQANTAAQRLAVEAPEQQAKAALAVQTLQARNAYARALQSGDQKAVQRAEDNLRAIQGKYEKEAPPDLYSTTPIPAGVDPLTGMPRGAGAIVTNKRSGETRIISADEAKGAPAAPGSVANATPRAQYDTLPKGAKYIGPDGKQYIKG